MFLLQLLEVFELGGGKSFELLVSSVTGHLRGTHLATRFRDRCAELSLLQPVGNLLAGETATLHGMICWLGFQHAGFIGFMRYTIVR